MDTMAALALATDPPTDAILDRPPQPKSAPLINYERKCTTTHRRNITDKRCQMWKMIIG
jgi:hypothetical protein